MKKNYLDTIPIINGKIRYLTRENKTTLFIKNVGLFNRLAQILFSRPKISQIHLDEKGSIVWSMIDGKTNIYEIAKNICTIEKKDIETACNEVAVYTDILFRCNFIFKTN